MVLGTELSHLLGNLGFLLLEAAGPDLDAEVVQADEVLLLKFKA